MPIGVMPHDVVWVLAVVTMVWGVSLIYRGVRGKSASSGGVVARRAIVGGTVACLIGAALVAAGFLVWPEGAGANMPRLLRFVAIALGALPLGLLVVAIFLIARGLLFDRARGRRRCPKCAYDMGPLADRSLFVCPECGHDAVSESSLRRTRRHRRPVLIGLVLLFAAYAVTRIPYVINGGSKGLLPTTVMIAGMWHWPTHWMISGTWSDRTTIQSRLQAGRAYEWQREWAVRRCEAMMDHPVPLSSFQYARRIHELLVPHYQIYIPVKGYVFAATQLVSTDPQVVDEAIAILDEAPIDRASEEPWRSKLVAELNAAADAIARALDSENPRAVLYAAKLLNEVDSHKRESVKAVLRSMSGCASDGSYVAMAVSVLARAAGNPDAVNAVLAKLEDPAPAIRRQAVFGVLGASKRGTLAPEVIGRLQAILEGDPPAGVGYAAARVIVVTKRNEGAPYSWLVEEASDITTPLGRVAFESIAYDPVESEDRMRACRLIPIGLRDAYLNVVSAAIKWAKDVATRDPARAAGFRGDLESLRSHSMPYIRSAAEEVIEILDQAARGKAANPRAVE